MHTNTTALLRIASVRAVRPELNEEEQAQQRTNQREGADHGDEDDGEHLGRLGRKGLLRHRLAHPDKRCNHSVHQASRKLVGPLVHRLVGDANCVGCGGYRASEQFNGFSFQHESIEPQFTLECNPSSVRGCDHSTMVGLGERLAAAMEARNVTVSALSKAVGVSYQGIKKAVDGKTKEMDSANLFKIANFLRVNPIWLRTGEGTRDIDEDDVLTAHAVVEPYDGRARREVDESEWALLEDFKMLPDDEKAALRATLKSKADQVRKIVAEYLGKRGMNATPVADERVAAAFGPPPPPPPPREKTAVSSYKKITPVPVAPAPERMKKGR